MSNDLTSKTNKELEEIMRRGENTNIPGSLHQRVKIELELRDRKRKQKNLQKIHKVFKQNLLEKKIKRGKESWNYIYLVFGILLTIEIFVISVLPFEWPKKIAIFIALLAATSWLCLLNSWFQNKLIGFKIKIEEVWRKI